MGKITKIELSESERIKLNFGYKEGIKSLSTIGSNATCSKVFPGWKPEKGEDENRLWTVPTRRLSARQSKMTARV